VSDICEHRCEFRRTESSTEDIFFFLQIITDTNGILLITTSAIFVNIFGKLMIQLGERH